MRRNNNSINPNISVEDSVGVLHQFFIDDPKFFLDLFSKTWQSGENQASDRQRSMWDASLDPLQDIESEQDKKLCYEVLEIICERIRSNQQYLDLYCQYVSHEFCRAHGQRELPYSDLHSRLIRDEASSLQEHREVLVAEGVSGRSAFVTSLCSWPANQKLSHLVL